MKLQSVVFKEEHPFKNMNIVIELFFIVPLGILLRWILFPMILSEFQEAMKHAIECEKEAYRANELNRKAIEWNLSDFIELVFDVFDKITYVNALQKIKAVRKILPDSSCSERFRREICKNVDAKANNTFQSLGISVTNLLDDFDKIQYLNHQLITYYHIDRNFNNYNKKDTNNRHKSRKIWKDNIYLIMDFYKNTISN